MAAVLREKFKPFHSLFVVVSGDGGGFFSVSFGLVWFLLSVHKVDQDCLHDFTQLLPPPAVSCEK